MGRKLAPKATRYDGPGGTSWRVRLRVNGRQTTETFITEVAAQVFIARMLDPAIGPERAVELRDREDTASSGYIPTLAELLAKHVDDLTGVDQRTKDDYPAVARRSWLKMLGPLRVDEITRSDVARWVNSEDGHHAPKTIRNAHSLLSSVLTTAEREGYIGTNPAKGTRLPRSGEEDEEAIRFLSYADFDRLFAEIPERHRAFVTLLFGTGLRFSEATALQCGDITLDAVEWVDGQSSPSPRLRVVRAWKKGRRIGPPKSRAGRRTVTLPAQVVEVVAPLLAGRPAGSWLFTTLTGKPITHSNFFNRVWKPAVIRASICEDHRAKGCKCITTKPGTCQIHTQRDEDGHQILPEPCGCAGTVSPRPRIHDARHTHASWLIALGVRLEVIQERLGHEDYGTTRKIYGHLMPDMHHEAGQAASLAFSATSLRAIGG